MRNNFPPLKVGQRWLWKCETHFIGKIIKVHNETTADIKVIMVFDGIPSCYKVHYGWDWGRSSNILYWTYLQGQDAKQEIFGTRSAGPG